MSESQMRDEVNRIQGQRFEPSQPHPGLSAYEADRSRMRGDIEAKQAAEEFAAELNRRWGLTPPR